MNLWIKIAWRNLWKNRRRSLFTLCAIAFGYAAVNLFGGFTTYIFRGLEEAYVYAHGNGHLKIFREGFLQRGFAEPGRYLFTPEEAETIRAVCAKDARIELVTPELHFTGLISNGDVSTIFVGAGRDPEACDRIRNAARSSIADVTMFRGRPLTTNRVYGVGLSSGLAERLGVSTNDRVILMATTIDGQMNALDGEVRQTFDAPLELLNDKTVYTTDGYARKLYDTARSDRFSVLLDHKAAPSAVRRDLGQALSARGIETEIKTWDELRVSYLRTRRMFNAIFMFVFVVVFVIVVLSVINTLSMTVLERTREIGTLRALGLRRAGVATLFATESALLGVLGCLLGIVITVAVWAAIQGIQPTWIPPNMPMRVVWEVLLVPSYLLTTFGLLVLLAVAAAVLPARRASRMLIIDALGHI
ncbi:ABC transporter permease [Kiritimatiella glycovorans]|uniref:ABC transporter permease YtrF n=1 Tax=Kiritimatiella glycovorans TaxID=1307763 RepID=A0A0G3EJZ7_9BACT|nr:ABC transporter permease [Kiritimatiella glycovorans]AKJ65115.1 ABC transporter permease YtrF precursor [Kiritimatiella glycovorans]